MNDAVFFVPAAFSADLRRSSSCSATVLCPLALLAGLLAAGCVATEEEEPIFSEATAELTLSGPAVYDAGTSCTVGGVTMHCCPLGKVMIGANVSGNSFKCQGAINLGPRFLDSSTQRNGMHSCPWGSVMVGLHASQNKLACQYASVTTEVVDGNPLTHDGFMHVCPFPYAMTGINVSRNYFNCGS